MKQIQESPKIRILFGARRNVAIALMAALCLDSCFLKQDRMTVVYGNITDQNGQPVDSILVMIDGVKGFNYETLKEVFSDEKGNYELVLEVPRKYGSANVLIPFGSFDNPKYQKNYKGVYVHKMINRPTIAALQRLEKKLNMIFN